MKKLILLIVVFTIAICVAEVLADTMAVHISPKAWDRIRCDQDPELEASGPYHVKVKTLGYKVVTNQKPKVTIAFLEETETKDTITICDDEREGLLTKMYDTEKQYVGQAVAVPLD